jgi:carbohydrate-selective porin OprB
MKRAPVLKAVFPGAVLAISFLLAEPSLAADTECSSDSGIPSGVIAPIDVGHLRKSLSDAGFTVGGFYLGETFANTGGIHQGATYDGVLWTYLLADLHKAGLWKGLCFYTDAYQIHGRSITADDIGSLVTVSNYEALPSTRLSELWLEQHMFNDHLTVKERQARRRHIFAKRKHACYGHAERADADPHNIGGTYRQALQRQRQHHKTGDGGSKANCTGPEVREAVSEFQRDGPHERS